MKGYFFRDDRARAATNQNDVNDCSEPDANIRGG